jgi:hypothetical protein
MCELAFIQRFSDDLLPGASTHMMNQGSEDRDTGGREVSDLSALPSPYIRKYKNGRSYILKVYIYYGKRPPARSLPPEDILFLLHIHCRFCVGGQEQMPILL